MELVGDQGSSSEAPLSRNRGGSKGDVRREVTARESMEKSWHVRIIDKKVEVFQNEEISGGRKNGRGNEVVSAIHLRGANRGSLKIEKRQ